jgi:PAS domain S-box-containing protein
MPRDIPPRRLSHTDSVRPTPGGAGIATASLVSLLAHTARLIDLLPHLHQYAIDATGGATTLLFEGNVGSAGLRATSGFGLDTLPIGAWAFAPRESRLVNEALAARAPRLVAYADHDAPDLAHRLARPAVLLIPLVRGEDRVGLLAIGFDSPPPADIIERGAVDVADAFLTALELARLRQRDQVQQDLRELMTQFAESLSATLNLAAGLDVFCHRAKELFGADRASVWIHDRRSRHLALRASSDSAHAARGVRVSTEDDQAPAAIAMRRARSEIVRTTVDDAVTSMVTVPLRGCRRALGTIVFEGVRVETGGEIELLERADELGRQLSATVENMQLLDEVLRSRRELENTFDSIAHLVVVSDRRGRIVHVNEAFANRVGRRREQLLDRPLVDFIGSELHAWLAKHEAAVVRPDGQAAPTCELVDPVLNGPFMFTVTDLLNQEHERVGAVLVARDLTPQNKLEAEREELRKRLTQSEKLAALGQFVAGIAHELNNPLQGVLGHLELLRATGAFPKQLRREVQTIYREADRAAKIVRNLLVFAGSWPVARRAVSLNAVLQKVVALRTAACRAADIELVRHYDDKLPRVKSDPLLLHQVFLNMVMNAEHAIAATGRGGRIEIATAVSPSGDRVVATVRDTGTGLAPDVVSHIFEPFYTTKEVGKGTGLGLAIAYGIVQDHGGDITAANHPDGGAVFTVELPITTAAGR